MIIQKAGDSDMWQFLSIFTTDKIWCMLVQIFQIVSEGGKN